MTPMATGRLIRTIGSQRNLALSLLAFLCILPLTANMGSRLIMFSVLILVFITGPFAVARTRLSFLVTCGLALLVFIPGIASAIGGYEWSFRLSIVAGVMFFGFLAGLLAKELLLDEKEVNSETLWAAVNVYVLIGLCFAFFYASVSFVEPNSFIGKFMDQPMRDQVLGFVYFSFVTLTTLGYGDITPSGVWVATLTYLEALIGQLYVAIMIARLVGLYLTGRS